MGDARRGAAWGFREVCSVLWALVPIGSVGILTPVVTVVAPMRVRTRTNVMVASVLTAVWLVGIVGISLTPTNQAANGLSVIPLLLAACGAVGFGFTTRTRVFGFVEDQERHAVATAAQHLAHRDAARKIARDNPRLAHELGIGRPDVTTDYDDGGLVDVNHVSADALVRAGVDRALANRIVARRDEIHGFDSLADLELNLGLTPQSLDDVADVLLFLR